MAGYIQRLDRLSIWPRRWKGAAKLIAIQAGASAGRREPAAVTDEAGCDLAEKLRRKIEEELQYPSTIKITVIRTAL